MCDYEKWKNANGELLPIKDMTTKHIRNCMNLICNSMQSYNLEIGFVYLAHKSDGPSEETLNKSWCKLHGSAYLNAFDMELKSRNQAY